MYLVKLLHVQYLLLIRKFESVFGVFFMDSKGYMQLNKYFAFAFVVFAVLSGVSDNYTGEATAKSKAGNLAHFFHINQLFIQDSGDITARVFINKYNSLSAYLKDSILKQDIYNIIFISTATTIFFAVICLNNQIMQNNIWRKAVF